MCMCGEWMVYGDDGDNNGESPIVLVALLYIPSLLFWNFLRRVRCSIFSFSFVSGGYCTPNSTVGHLSIFTTRLTFSFLSRFRALAPFYFLISSFSGALISCNNIASGSNQGNLSIYFTGRNRNRRMFLAILSRIRSRILLGGFGDGNEWIYVDAYFRSRSSMYEWTFKWILILTTWQAPKGLHSMTTLNAHKQ